MVQHSSRPALLAVLASVMLLTTGFAGVALAGGTSTTVAQTDEPDGEDVIESFTDRLSSLDSVAFTRTTETTANGESRSSTERIAADFDAFEKRVDVLNSSHGDNTTTVVNESTTTTYNADENTVTAHEHRREMLLPMVEQLTNESAITYEYAGTDTIDGQRVHVLDGTARGRENLDATTSLTVYVGTESHFPVRVDVDVVSTAQDYNFSSTITFDNVSIDEPIPDSTFELDAPDDATDRTTNRLFDFSRFDSHDALRSNADLSVPSAELVDGYAFDRARILDGEEYYRVSATYKNGTNRLTISVRNDSRIDYGDIDKYESVTLGEHTGWYVEYGDYAFLHWDGNGQSYSLYGQLSRENALDIAAAATE